MADHHHPVDVDPQSLQRAQTNWHGFVQLIKYSTIAIIALLIGMAVFLV